MIGVMIGRMIGIMIGDNAVPYRPSPSTPLLCSHRLHVAIVYMSDSLWITC